MNHNTRNALEALKRETLLVLYQEYATDGQYLGIKEVRERMGIPPTPGANQPNDMVCHFLLHLVEDKAVEYIPRNKYQITQKGISMIGG